MELIKDVESVNRLWNLMQVFGRTIPCLLRPPDIDGGVEDGKVPVQLGRKSSVRAALLGEQGPGRPKTVCENSARLPILYVIDTITIPRSSGNTVWFEIFANRHFGRGEGRFAKNKQL